MRASGRGRTTRSSLLGTALELAGRGLAERLRDADSQAALRKVWRQARKKVPVVLRNTLDVLVGALVEVTPDADATRSKPEDADGDIIDMVEGKDYFVRPPRPRPTDT